MYKTVILLPDGTELTSGSAEKNAIKSFTYTQCVNSGTELTLGSVCTNMVEAVVIVPHGGLKIAEGDEIKVYRVSGDTRVYLGLYTTEKPVRSGANCLKITAYDRVSRLEKDLTQWLDSLQEWPYRLEDFARMVCQACDTELAEGQLPNGAYAVQKFSAQGITGRKLMQWAGQLAGRFLRATPEGKLEFAWYAPNAKVQVAAAKPQVWYSNGQLFLKHPGVATDSDGQGNVTLNGQKITFTNDGNGNITLQLPEGVILPYRSGSLSYSDYQVSPIGRVHLKNSRDDVGTVWPADVLDSVNTYVIEENYLLTAACADDLKPIAQTLYEQLCQVTYTPCKVRLPAGFDLQAGDILTVTDGNGVRFCMYVMKRVQSGQSDSLECSGSPDRHSAGNINEYSAQSLSGKVTELRLNVDGLHLENRDTAGNVAKLSARLGGIEAEVSSQQENISGMQQSITQLRQDTRQVQLSIQTVQTQGADKVRTETGYTFDQKGLTIKKQGSSMENLLDDTGMYVKRLGQVVLQANDAGVEAVDVTVRNYLIIGDHARLEDYSSGGDMTRTACFWI